MSVVVVPVASAAGYLIAVNWEAVGRPEVGRDARYAKNADRRAARAEIVAEIQKVLATRSRDEWLRIFVDAKVPAGPVNRVDQVANDPELVSRGLFYTDRAHGRNIPQVGLGIGVDGSNASYRTPPPKLGEHTEEVLRSLGYDDARIGELRASKVI